MKPEKNKQIKQNKKYPLEFYYLTFMQYFKFLSDIMSDSQVNVLFDGYSIISEDGKIMKANCTCTLIQSKGLNIIVDTMTPWDKDKILSELKNKHDLEPSQINYVVSTHGHSDHVGNNNLFLDAIHIVSKSVSKVW